MAITAMLALAGCDDTSEPATDGQASMSTSESEPAIKTDKPVESSPAEKMLAKAKGAGKVSNEPAVKTETKITEPETAASPKATKVIAKTVLMEAIASAKSSNKSVLVHFSADW